jgi:uncharacterized protein YeaC (DUF1315 family)
MNYRDYVENLAPEVYERLKRAVETGRWPDGRPVSPEQREHCLQAVIAWGERHLPPEERVGYIDRGRKARRDGEGAQPLRFVDEEGS